MAAIRQRTRTRRTALWKDAWRAIAGNGKRFTAIAVIVAVGVMMMGALSSIGADLKAGLDEFFDETRMHDLSLVSTLGLDEGDLDALRAVDGVERVAGQHSASAHTTIDGKQASATVTALNDDGLDQPYLSEGRLPGAAHEIAVTAQYLTDSGKRIGDTLTFATESAAALTVGGADDVADEFGTTPFAGGDYTIVGVIIDPNDVVNPTGPLALVSGAKTVYPLVVAPDALAADDAAYTAVLITVDGAAAADTYGDEYRRLVDETRSHIEQMQSDAWIIRDRSALTSYEDVRTESDMILRLGTLFPMLFLLIAVLVSLTAVARMVEEDRQLIGTYKALGYTRRETMVKYVLYSAAAALAGGLVGDLLGLLGLPLVFTTRMLRILYVIPDYPLLVDWTIGIGGIALFLVLITGSAAAVCAGSLRLEPAELLRPKAPKAGRTILLQRVGFIWNRLSFLGKVTARNLLRYKSRALMVIVGVLGCTALMTAGFGMVSSALTLMPRQFGEVATYDVMALTSPADHDEAQRSLDADATVGASLALHVESATLTGEDGDTRLSVQLMVIPDGESVDGYLDLHTPDGEPISVDDGPSATAVISTNAATTLALGVGGEAGIVDAMMNAADVRVSGVAQYYTGNIVVMGEAAYRAAFDIDPDAVLTLNADLIQVKGDVDAQIAFADELAGRDAYLSVVSTARQTRDFGTSFLIFFVMVGFIVVMAAILAVVVLYTLASTNISERERELATIKVLGFRRGEVHGYVNKEMLLLSAIGIVIGLPCGRALIGFLLSRLNLPGMTIVPSVAWYCYAAAAALALAFTLLVSVFTNRSLDRIDMVGALKSPE